MRVLVFFCFFYEKGGSFLTLAQLDDCLSCCPVIAAVHEEGFFEALKSPCDVIFMLGSNCLPLKSV